MRSGITFLLPRIHLLGPQYPPGRNVAREPQRLVAVNPTRDRTGVNARFHLRLPNMFWRIGRRGFRLFRRLRPSNSAQSHQKETDLKPATPNSHLVILRESLARVPDPCPVSRGRACP